MITAVHAMIYTRDAEAVRNFFQNVLKRPFVDAGDGWKIFNLPAAELGVHPDEGERHELYLMCDDIEQTRVELRERGVETSEVKDEGWGLSSSIQIPGGPTLGLYEPRHKTAHDVEAD